MAEMYEHGAEAMNAFNSSIVEEFRSTDGKVGGQFEGMTLLLLHTTGAKSGQPRVTPLAFFADGDKYVVVGSFAGSPKDPAWVHNLRAHPQVQLEVGAETFDAVARELPEAERGAMYPRIVEWAPVFAEYQAKAGRTIPLLELTRV